MEKLYLIKVYLCMDCAMPIDRHTALYRGGRCKSCAQKGLKNINYKHGRTSAKHYCIDCGKEISWRAKRCNSCARKKYGYKGKNNPFFGKHHSKKTRLKLKGKLPKHGKRIYYKNVCMRSSWETKFAQFLDLSGIEYKYEPKTFNLDNTTYTPDFYLPEFNCYIEIKGWWREKGKKKFDLFKKKYPNIKINLLMEKELQEIGVL